MQRDVLSRLLPPPAGVVGADRGEEGSVRKELAELYALIEHCWFVPELAAIMAACKRNDLAAAIDAAQAALVTVRSAYLCEDIAGWLVDQRERAA